MQVQTCHGIYVKVRGPGLGIDSLLPLVGYGATQVTGSVVKCLYPLNHLANPTLKQVLHTLSDFGNVVLVSSVIRAE